MIEEVMSQILLGFCAVGNELSYQHVTAMDPSYHSLVLKLVVASEIKRNKLDLYL